MSALGGQKVILETRNLPMEKKIRDQCGSFGKETIKIRLERQGCLCLLLDIVRKIHGRKSKGDKNSCFRQAGGYQKPLFGKERDPMRMMPTSEIIRQLTNENEGVTGEDNGRQQTTEKGGDQEQI